MDHPCLSLRELKAAADATPRAFAIRAQVAAIHLKKTKADKDYLELALNDGSDSVTLRLWLDHPLFPAAQRLSARAWLEIHGEWTQNHFGLDFRPGGSLRTLDEAEAAELLGGPETLRRRQSVDWAHITQTVASLADPRLQAVCQRFLDVHGDRFRRTAAARDYHHARRGGLVEHVAQMMRSATALAGAYPHLNRDLLLAGVLFHDCGKLWENCYQPDGFVMPYEERGELLGHITIGIELVNRLWRDAVDSPAAADWPHLVPATEDVRLHLLHLIASHHGEQAFGSPVVPKTPEAVVLHHVDNIDAKLEMFAEGYATSAPLGKNVVERRRPLTGNLVRPLPHAAPDRPD
jgi:3'-5' exoribonuclease